MPIYLYKARIEKYGGEVMHLDVYASTRDSAIEAVRNKLDFDYIHLEVEKEPRVEIQDGYIVIQKTTRF